jgi:VanZ family protein
MRFLRSRLVLLLYWLACFLITHVPLPLPEGEPLYPHLDKVVHFGMYGVLAGLLALRLPAAKVAALVALYAAFDETTQPLVGRDFDWLDLAADGMGALLGALLGGRLSLQARK